MLRPDLIEKHRCTRASSDQRNGSVEGVGAPAVCEVLERRRLLAMHTWQAPSGTSVVYLEGDVSSPGVIKVRLNSETAPFVTNPDPFTNQNGMSIIQAPTGSTNFLFVDKVPAELKPATDGTHRGIKVEAPSGSGATLKIDALQIPNDRSFTVAASSSTETLVTVFSFGSADTNDARIGEGVNKLSIRTSNFQGSNHWPTLPDPGSHVSVPNLAPGIHLTVDTGTSTYAKTVLGSEGIGYIHDQATVITGAGHSLVTTYGKDLDHLTLALVDFGPRETAGNNRLEVLGFSTVTLDQVPGSSEHVVVVEYAKVDGNPFDNKPALLLVADQSTIDDLDVFSGGRAVVEPDADGTSIPLFDIEELGSASIDGNSTIGILTNEGDLRFTHQATQTIGPTTVDQFKIGAGTTLPTSSGNVVIDTNADVTILAPTTGHSPSHIGDLRINQGALLTLASHPTNQSARVLGVGTIFMEKTNSSPEATLDLKNNAMLVDYSGDSPVGEVRDSITFAYNGGDWEDFGIGSSTAAAVWDDTGNTHKTGVGYGEATDIFSSFSASWESQSVDDSTVLIKYTFYGDANLDGAVNLQDFNKLAANFGGSEKRWAQGDFNYDRNVNLQDFNRLAGNFGQTGLGPGVMGEGEDEITTEDLEEMLPD